MFSKLALFVAAAFAVSAIASDNKCNTGPIQCCNSYQTVEQYKASKEHEILGIDVSNVTGQIGFNCSPISVVALASGSKCESKPVCCENNNYKGLIAIGCTPIDVL